MKQSSALKKAKEMAQSSLELEKKKATGSVSGATTIPCPGFERASMLVCRATGLPCNGLFFGDRAQQYLGFTSPLVAVMALRNAKHVLATTPKDHDAFTFPLIDGASPRLLSGAKNRFLRIANFDKERLDEQADRWTGNGTSIAKFKKALEAKLATLPFAIANVEGGPYFPLPRCVANGHTWAAISGDLSVFLEEAKKFEEAWGWHCDDLFMSAQALKHIRRVRRAKPSYTVKMVTTFRDNLGEEHQALSSWPDLKIEDARRTFDEQLSCFKSNPDLNLRDANDRLRLVKFDERAEILLFRSGRESLIESLRNPSPPSSSKRQRREACLSSSSEEESHVLDMPILADD